MHNKIKSHQSQDSDYSHNHHLLPLEMMEYSNKLNVHKLINLDLRGEDGKPITKPRNLLAGTNRSGQGKKGYFAIPDSIYQGD